jgi:hypothetical protein
VSFAIYQEADRRLVILKGLEAAVQYRANALLLRRYCDALGHVVSADRIEADLQWLREMDLVHLEAASGVTVASLTVRGQDVASGRATVPGVQRPMPGV